MIKTLTINGYEVPMPLYAKPESEKYVFIIAFYQPDLWEMMIVDQVPEFVWALGVCHLTVQAAEDHARAVLSFTEIG